MGIEDNQEMTDVVDTTCLKSIISEIDTATKTSNRKKQAIHTTLSRKAIKVLERYEEELGCPKNTVIEKALDGMDRLASDEDIGYIHQGCRGDDGIYFNVSKNAYGFNDFFEDPFCWGDVISINGPEDSGKSSMALALAFATIQQYGTPCFLFTNKSRRSIFKNANKLGFDSKELKSYVRNGQLIIHSYPLSNVSSILDVLDSTYHVDVYGDTGTTRKKHISIVIDPINMLPDLFTGSSISEDTSFGFNRLLETVGANIVIVGEQYDEARSAALSSLYDKSLHMKNESSPKVGKRFLVAARIGKDYSDPSDCCQVKYNEAKGKIISLTPICTESNDVPEYTEPLNLLHTVKLGEDTSMNPPLYKKGF